MAVTSKKRGCLTLMVRQPIFFIVLLEYSLPLAYLHIAYIAAINSKADSGAYLMETIGAGSPRVDVE